MNRYPPDPNGDVPPAYRITAAYQATGMTDEFVVPALKALFLGFFGGLTIGILVGWSHGHGWLMRINAPLAGLVTGLGLTGWLFFRFSERAYWMIERIAGLDLNMDGYVGEPVPYYEPPPLRVMVEQNNGQQTDILHVPAKYVDKLRMMAPFLLQGKPFSEREWKGVLGQGEFDDLRNEFLARGIIRWNNETVHQQGVSFTRNGRRVLEEFVSQKPTALPYIPYPTEDDSRE